MEKVYKIKNRNNEKMRKRKRKRKRKSKESKKTNPFLSPYSIPLKGERKRGKRSIK